MEARLRSRAGRSNAGAPGLPHRVLSNPATLVTPDSFHPAHGLESSPLRPPGVRLAPVTSPSPPPRQKGSAAPGIYGPGSLPPGLLWVGCSYYLFRGDKDFLPLLALEYYTSPC